MADPKWPEIQRYAEEEVGRLHRCLESIQREDTTNQLRGEIRAFRRLIENFRDKTPPDPSRRIQPDDHQYT